LKAKLHKEKKQFIEEKKQIIISMEREIQVQSAKAAKKGEVKVKSLQSVVD
jgi:hypothetical protein